MAATVTFLGNVEFEPSSDPVWSGTSYGLDVCRVPYRGAVTKKEKFLSSLRKFSALAGFPKMYYLDYSDDGALVFPTIELIFNGFRNGSPPEPQGVDGVAIQNAQASISPTSGTYAGQNINLQVTYRANRTKWTWFQTTDPESTALPAFVRCRKQVNPLTNILLWRVTGPNGASGTIGLAEATQLLNQLVVAEILTDLQSEDIVPKALWKCEASVDFGINGA